MGRLSGSAVLVTGASSGIGRAIAVRCAREGARVLATGRRADALEATAREAGGDVQTLAADLGDAGAAADCVAAAVERLGGLSGVVHAAGTVRRGEDVRKTTDEEWSQMLDTNLGAAFRLARAAARAMTGGGSLVMLGSQLARIAAPGYPSYCAAKGGVESLVRALAVDLGPLGIRVNSLSPGVVVTPMAYVDRPDFDAQRDAIAARHPLRRVGEPDDMGGPAVFLLSSDSAWMTGQSLVVDGGFTIQ
jgi:NAD(P)-dependent dehydrogenase (short-subunit alcohol dehydrogenase family)